MAEGKICHKYANNNHFLNTIAKEVYGAGKNSSSKRSIVMVFGGFGNTAS